MIEVTSRILRIAEPRRRVVRVIEAALPSVTRPPNRDRSCWARCQGLSPRTLWLAVLLTMAMAACATQGETTATALTIPPTTTAIEATTITTPATTTTSIVDDFETIDVVEIAANAAVLEMVDIVRLGWGEGVGEVGESADFGPCCFDVLPDGRIVLVDG